MIEWKWNTVETNAIRIYVMREIERMAEWDGMWIFGVLFSTIESKSDRIHDEVAHRNTNPKRIRRKCEEKLTWRERICEGNTNVNNTTIWLQYIRNMYIFIGRQLDGDCVYEAQSTHDDATQHKMYSPILECKSSWNDTVARKQNQTNPLYIAHSFYRSAFIDSVRLCRVYATSMHRKGSGVMCIQWMALVWMRRT